MSSRQSPHPAPTLFHAALVSFSASLIFIAAAPAAIGAPSAPPGQPAQPPAKRPPAASPAQPTKAPPPDPNVPEKTFALTLPNGTKVQAKVFPNLAWPGKIIHFDPYFPRTDGNMHAVALNSMWEIYGRQRGSFQLQDASISSRPKIGAIIVYALKSGSKFCVYPVSTDEKGTTLAAIKVWIE